MFTQAAGYQEDAVLFRPSIGGLALLFEANDDNQIKEFATEEKHS